MASAVPDMTQTGVSGRAEDRCCPSTDVARKLHFRSEGVKYRSGECGNEEVVRWER